MNHTMHTGRLTVGELREVVGDNSIPSTAEVIIVSTTHPPKYVGMVERDALTDDPPKLVLRVGGYVE